MAKALSTDVSSQIQNQVRIPDRFEVLERLDGANLGTIVVPVGEILDEIDRVSSEMHVSGRGAFMILRGDSGAGKSTALNTLNLFRESIETIKLSSDMSIVDFFRSYSPPENLAMQVIVLDEREATISFSDSELESWLHAINSFIRRSAGSKCLVVWPCNTDGLMKRLIDLAQAIGGRSLLGSGEDAVLFHGPPKSAFSDIASKTLGSLNQGASVTDFGLTTNEVSEFARVSRTVGDFLGKIRSAIIQKQKMVSQLLPKEQPNLWVVVVAGNEPDGEVAGLTRGNSALVDIDRLMTSTEANIVQDLKKIPDKIGLLASVLNAKILHLPVLAATASVRAFADNELEEKLRNNQFSIARSSKDEAVKRLSDCELGAIFQRGTQRTLKRGKKLGSESRSSFEKVAEIAQNNDSMINRAIAEALRAANLIKSYEIESSLGGGYKIESDIVVECPLGKVRIEMMWRKRTGRADIANYTLKKLEAYGKAIGFLE
jgi:hypothetical protein